ncbi:MAG TPA: 5-dehydro-2-deoxygluconokinase [Geminicoccaceae bacterium]|nr:5-dehydro-2-deoxygluconokinase [Geminicoccaceae bacterium]
MAKRLDVICIGRSSVDLYGQQVGGRLEEMASFAKYVGGCPTNISIGTARLGLKPGLITGVGDEHMGRFIKEQAAAEGVDISNVKTDPTRLTSLVILGIRDQETFPLIFYRENCADAGLTEDDIDEAFIASAKAVLVSGTHFSRPNLDAMSKKAMRLAKKHGGRVVFDVDYRPVLWGLTGHGLGEERFVENRDVSAHLQTIVPLCDVVVGTEEEIHIAGGSTDTLAACRRIRELAPDALIVVKRGPMGCTVFDGDIPDDLEQGIKGPGFPVEVFNVLGAGDAFMSGFLRGYLRDEPIETCCKYANACGAFAVSRHGCAPAIPSWTELQYFFAHGSREHALRHDAGLEQIHWSTNRTREWPQLLAMAFDHRAQLEAMADEAGISREHIPYFKQLCLKAARQAAGGRTDFGILLDRRLGRDALDEATGDRMWIGRPIELPGSLPLRFEGGADVGCTLLEWPVAHCVKCLVYYHPDDPEALREEQEAQLLRLFEAARRTGHELLLEVIASRSRAPVDERTVARALDRIYGIGVFPDWWKLVDPGSQAAWEAIAAAIGRHDRYCRGVLLLGLDAPPAELEASFARAARQPVCKGFAIGRTIFGAPAKAWMAGEIDDGTAVARMAETYAGLIRAWDRARGRAGSSGEQATAGAVMRE